MSLSRLGLILLTHIRAIHPNNSKPPKPDAGIVINDVPSPSREKWIGNDSPELPWPCDMEEDARSLLEIRLAEQQDRTYRYSSTGRDTRQEALLFSMLQELKAKFGLALILLLFAGTELSAQTIQFPGWSTPKLSAGYAALLQQRGQLTLVDNAFDAIAYYPWRGFNASGGGVTTGLSNDLNDGRTVAYIATEGRSDNDIVDTLIELAIQRGHREKALAFMNSVCVRCDNWPNFIFAVVVTAVILFIVVSLAATIENECEDEDDDSEYEDEAAEYYTASDPQYAVSQVLWQKRMEIEYAQLEAQKAKVELEKEQARTAIRSLRKKRERRIQGGREDYDL